MTIFQDEKIWRILTNFWTVVFIAFLIFDFFWLNRFEYLTIPFSVIYAGVLGLYASTKEFDRWYEMHEGRHPGELKEKNRIFGDWPNGKAPRSGRGI